MIDKLIHFIAYGSVPLSFWGYLAFTLVATHVTIVSVTLFLHRAQAHRALELHPIVSHFFRFWLFMTTGMQTKQWVAVHRKHHAKSETEEDPHSPQVYGIKKVLMYGADLYRKACKNTEDMDRYSVGTPDDWIERNLYSAHPKFGIFTMMFIDIALFGSAGLLIWAIQMAWIPFFAAGVINGVAHYIGYRNFECPDAASNISPWGILIGGEELHNNHHTYGTSAKFSVKKWEFDIGWMYIKILSAFKLAKVKHLPPKLKESSSKKLDFDTVKALVVNRFQILDTYWHKVMTPTFLKEKQNAKPEQQALLRKRKKLLLRETSLIKNKDKANLETLLGDHNALKTVYQYKLRLQEIWSKEVKSREEQLAKLEKWCQEAEQTGIEALQEFVDQLKQYHFQTTS